MCNPELLNKLISKSDHQPYHKSIFFEILCYSYRLTSDKKISKEIRKLWDEAKQNQSELIGYMISSIVDNEVDGYSDEIQKAYQHELVDLRYFDKIETLEPMTHMRKYDADSIEATDPDAMTKSFKMAVDHCNQQSPQTLDEEIDKVVADGIEESIRQQIAFESMPEDDPSLYDDIDSSFGLFNAPPPPFTLVREGEKVGRNDPCPCGSGNKYKKCCLNMN